MFEEEEVKTYSELVDMIRSELSRHMREELERFSRTISGVRLGGGLLRIGHGGVPDLGVVGAVDGGSGVLSLADRDLGFAAALAVVDRGRGYERRLARPRILVQMEGEGDGEFEDRLDMERETMVLDLASAVLEEVDVLVVDGPLILVKRGRVSGDYVASLARLLRRAGELGRAVVGFVKRPRSRLLEELSGHGLYDREGLGALLERYSAYPWPPMTPRGERVRVTYVKAVEPPAPGVFRIDIPPHMDDGSVERVLEYLVSTADPLLGVPAILMKADEEVKVHRRLIADLYRECFEAVSGGDPRLWSPVLPRYGERLW